MKFGQDLKVRHRQISAFDLRPPPTKAHVAIMEQKTPLTAEDYVDYKRMKKMIKTMFLP